MDGYHIVLLVLAFVLGVSIGSFVNVLVFRLRSGVRVSGRSKCLSCGKKLSPRMLVPLFSFLYQKGCCAHCGVRLSIQYPLVEGVLGAIYVVVMLVHGFDPLSSSPKDIFLTIGDAIVWTTLLSITVYDLRHKIIPDSFSLLLAVLSGVLLLFKWKVGILAPDIIPFLDSVPTWLDFAAGPLLAAPFAALWLFSGGRAMGLGDAKLAWGLGWFLGFAHGASAIVLAFWVAFFPSLFLLLLRKKHFTMKSEIPFAPFLVAGTFLAYAFGINILSWTL